MATQEAERYLDLIRRTPAPRSPVWWRIITRGTRTCP